MHRKIIIRMAIAISCFFLSCSEWTPEADGYFIVDGKRYRLHLAIIRLSPSISGNSFYATEIGFAGGAYQNAQIVVISSSKTLSSGVYPLEVVKSLIPPRTLGYSLSYGELNNIYSDAKSEGSLTVAISGNNYSLDFSGTTKGQNVQIHYAGRVQIDPF
jgi:hypothetical protein